MQAISNTDILQAASGERKESGNAGVGRKKIRRVSKPERILISRVESGEFEIDDLGQIWRVSVRKGLRSGGVHIVPIERRRAEHKTPAGYYQIRATVDGRVLSAGAHRLVWQFLNGDIPDGMVINHKNGIKDDNRPENLEVVTYSENMRHAHKTGLSNQWGERNPGAKLSDKEVVEIRELYATGNYRLVDLGVKYSVSFQTISDIVRGKRRSRQDGPLTTDAQYDHFRERGEDGRYK